MMLEHTMPPWIVFHGMSSSITLFFCYVPILKALISGFDVIKSIVPWLV